MSVVHFFLHLDLYLNDWVTQFGVWTYVILFAIIFCETGLVVAPFLPGDSLLFAVGALTTVDNAFLSAPLVSVVLILAAVIGDGLNYWLGFKFGPKVFKSETSRWFNKEHLLRSQNFYLKYGGKTVVLARFIPIVRTYAPFVAGIGAMRYSTFLFYNIFGAVIWVGSLVALGHFFGDIPAVKSRFHLVIVGIIVISFIPVVVEFFKARTSKRRSA